MRTCLLVDDDEDDREIFCLALNQADPSVKCLTARDGLEALLLLKEKSFVPDYIFLDLNMPRMDGKECLREIKKAKPPGRYSGDNLFHVVCRQGEG